MKSQMRSPVLAQRHNAFNVFANTAVLVSTLAFSGCVYDANIRSEIAVERAKSSGNCTDCTRGLVQAGKGVSAGNLLVRMDGTSGNPTSVRFSILGPAGKVLKNDTVEVGVWKIYLLADRTVRVRAANVSMDSTGKHEAMVDVAF